MFLRKLDAWDAWLAGLSFLLAFALYIRTLTPGLLPGDSGEFQTLAYLLGHTHPTGYPVYLVLAKLVTFLPVKDVAYRVNLFSTIMAALTVAGVYLSGRLLVEHRFAAFTGAMAVAVSPTFWSQAVIAEVYAPGAAFLVFVLLALLWWDRTGNPSALFLAGLLGGLSLGVHISVVLLAPAVLLYLMLDERRGGRMWRYALAGGVTGGLLTVLTFWLIDLRGLPVNYFKVVVEPSYSAWGLDAGSMGGTLERLFFGWSARQFQSFMFSDVSAVMPEQARAYWQNLPRELGWLLIGLALIGSIRLLVSRARLGMLLLIGLAVQFVCVFNYSIWDVYVFYIPSYIFLALLSVAGIGLVIDTGLSALHAFAPRAPSRWLNLFIQTITAFVVFGFSIWPVFQLHKAAVVKGEVVFTFEEYPKYESTLLDTARAATRALPPNAIVFTDWGRLWPYTYAAYIVEGRDDLLFIETNPADDQGGVAETLLAYIYVKSAHHPIFFSRRVTFMLAAGYKFVPQRYGSLRLYQILEQ